ncbi:triphosphoribosyl-dephospho-CoA synthase [Agrilactobacillus fermenti]|uniref:triphosphoribosyl-dephospho-CoA synthase n=1 Tax=Agrilactobacillus fermenti TaxID=2586909 RepID=UPI003A5C315A
MPINDHGLKQQADQLTTYLSRALLYELILYPKPGLVDPVDNGAHQDMDAFTFVDSITALTPVLHELVLAGLKYPQERPLAELFPELRRLGQQADQAMFAATKGINTHKGAIFTFALLAAGVGIVLQARQVSLHDWDTSMSAQLFTVLPEIAAPIQADFTAMTQKKSAPQLSYGERMYLTDGFRGIRGEALLGFPVLRDYGLPFLRATRTAPKTERLLDLLLTLLSQTQDANIIHRSDYQTLTLVQKQAKNILAQGGTLKLGREVMQKLNQDYITRNISPGGTADMLSASVFLGFLEQLFPV